MNQDDFLRDVERFKRASKEFENITFDLPAWVTADYTAELKKRWVSTVKKALDVNTLDAETKEKLVEVLHKPLCGDSFAEFEEVLDKSGIVLSEKTYTPKLYRVMKRILDTGGDFGDLDAYLNEVPNN